MITKEQIKEIDKLFEKYYLDKDKISLFKSLEEYAYPDGSWSMYIRMQLEFIE